MASYPLSGGGELELNISGTYLVLLADEAVVEDAEAFVAPEPDELRSGLELVDGAREQPLVHAAEVAQVEDVVEARRRGRQPLADEPVQRQDGLRERRGGA
eukprot:3190947-Pyramimonas_sp.AAC.1